jgi:hypothetical protein
VTRTVHKPILRSRALPLFQFLFFLASRRRRREEGKERGLKHGCLFGSQGTLARTRSAEISPFFSSTVHISSLTCALHRRPNDAANLGFLVGVAPPDSVRDGIQVHTSCWLSVPSLVSHAMLQEILPHRFSTSVRLYFPFLVCLLPRGLQSADIDEKEIRKEKPEELVVALAHAKVILALFLLSNLILLPFYFSLWLLFRMTVRTHPELVWIHNNPLQYIRVARDRGWKFSSSIRTPMDWEGMGFYFIQTRGWEMPRWDRWSGARQLARQFCVYSD